MVMQDAPGQGLQTVAHSVLWPYSHALCIVMCCGYILLFSCTLHCHVALCACCALMEPLQLHASNLSMTLPLPRARCFNLRLRLGKDTNLQPCHRLKCNIKDHAHTLPKRPKSFSPNEVLSETYIPACPCCTGSSAWSYTTGMQIMLKILP